MNSDIPLRTKIGVKNKHKNIPEIELNISKIKYLKRRYSISPKAEKISSVNNDSPKNKNNSLYFNMYKNKANDLLFTTKRTSTNQFRKRKSFANNNVGPKRRSQELSHTKTQKLIQMYNLKIEKDKIQRRKTIVNMFVNTKDNIQLNKIENNIKQAINNMKKEIEKKNIKRMSNSVKADIKNKLSPTPFLNLIKVKGNKKSKKKRNLKYSFLMKKKYYNKSFISKRKITKKRNKSFDFTLQQKKNIIKRLKNKIYKNKNKFSHIKFNTFINDEIENENKDNTKGFAFHPNSYFIRIFDLLLMISVFYSFVEIPLNVAKNKDIREVGPIFIEAIHYIIDLIFFLDFIICFFRGYYNNEMDIIIN